MAIRRYAFICRLEIIPNVYKSSSMQSTDSIDFSSLLSASVFSHLIFLPLKSTQNMMMATKHKKSCRIPTSGLIRLHDPHKGSYWSLPACISPCDVWISATFLTSLSLTSGTSLNIRGKTSCWFFVVWWVSSLISVPSLSSSLDLPAILMSATTMHHWFGWVGLLQELTLKYIGRVGEIYWYCLKMVK